ncbi:hypothetical protein JG688_00004330 [Phytophthora aleatoria]|uniref:Uncharacterized protein n=1 Tax=Phytophthora aleatoria TaxID=2496075 RepID=A0A8J5IQ80_9STRA|nr:hypothetical protein JG688_00004330 [Phytophthora aleatoria]
MRSPTLCRPRHLDPERLRARLGSGKFDKLRYHEAAVVSTGQFHLFALSSDTLFIVPLMSRGEAAPEMCFSLRNIAAVERVLPANKKQKGLLLLPTSQLFRLQLREVTVKKMPLELFFSTFEPQTQLFFQLSRALRVDFQSDVASGSDQVLAILLRTRKDYIDMYLRTPRFMIALSTSDIPHLEDVALKLGRFLETLRDRRRG